MVSVSTLKLALDRLTVAVRRAEGRTAPWSEGATVETAGAIPTVVLDSDASQTPRPVSANWAGTVVAGQRVRVEHAGKRLTITAAPVTDTGWQSFGAVALSGVTISSQDWRRVGNVVFCNLLLTTTTGQSVPTTGDIGNSVYRVQVSPAYTPASGAPTQAVGGHGASGRGAFGAIQSDGVLYVGAVAGSTGIASGDTLRLGGSYII